MAGLAGDGSQASEHNHSFRCLTKYLVLRVKTGGNGMISAYYEHLEDHRWHLRLEQGALLVSWNSSVVLRHDKPIHIRKGVARLDLECNYTIGP